MSTQYKYTNYDVGSAVPGDIIRYASKSNRISPQWFIFVEKKSKDAIGFMWELTFLHDDGQISKSNYKFDHTQLWVDYKLIK